MKLLFVKNYLKNLPILITVIYLLLVQNLLFSQTKLTGEEVKSRLNEDYEIIQENKSDELLYKIGILSASTGLMFLLDDPIRKNLKKNNSQDVFYLKAGNTLGVYSYHFAFAGTLYLTQFMTENKNIAVTGKILLESLIVSGLASISIKYIFGRSRPYMKNGNTKFNWFETENIFNSLPSGHVISAFTTSTVLSKQIGNPYVSIALYSLAGLTAYQRIASDNHWFSDVFLGASIGILVGEYFTMLNDSNEDKFGQINLIPFVSQHGTGVYLQVNL